MVRGKLQHSLRQRTSSRNDSGGGTILPLTTREPLSKQPNNMHRVGRRRRKTTRSSWEHRFKLRVILLNIMICILFIFAIGYMFHRVVRGRQTEQSLLFSQHYNKYGSTQTQHGKKEKMRQHTTITYDFTCKSHPNKKGILNDDYCDCPDGSDEPHTSACSDLLVGQRQFACNNNNNNNNGNGRSIDGSEMTSYVFTSRVKDGIADCHNNADEV